MINPTLVSHHRLAYALAEPAKIVFRGGNWPEATKIALFRELGFRRVGISSWFARAYEPAHPSHALPADRDYDPPASKTLTVVEKIEERLEVLRTRTKKGGKIVDISSDFQGHSDDNVIALIAARKAEDLGISRTFSQVKYGCTCGRCIGGFLSPRMHFVMLKQLSKIYQGLYGSISGDHSRIYFQKNPIRIPEIRGGYAWTFVKDPLKSLIFQSKDTGLGYCYVSLRVVPFLHRRVE
jgi:hypothetical protein